MTWFGHEPESGNHALTAFSFCIRERGAGAILVDCSVEDGVKDLRAFISEQVITEDHSLNLPPRRRANKQPPHASLTANSPPQQHAARPLSCRSAHPLDPSLQTLDPSLSQASAKGQFPGPCPVIQRGLASTLAQVRPHLPLPPSTEQDAHCCSLLERLFPQVAGAASSGVQGVCVSGAAGPNQDSLAQLVTGAHALGLEVLVEVQVRLSAVSAAGAQVLLCLAGTERVFGARDLSVNYLVCP